MKSLIITEKHEETSVEILFCLVSCFGVIVLSVNSIFRAVLGSTFSIDTLLVHGSYILLFLVALRVLIKNIKIQNFLPLFLLFFIILLWCENPIVRNKIITQYMRYCIPAFYFGYSLTNHKCTYDIMYKLAWIILGMLVIDVFALKVYDTTSSNHSLAYGALFSACVFVVNFICKKKAIDIVALLISSVLIVQSDTAGAIGALLLCGFLGILLETKELSIRKIVFLAVIGVLGIVVYTNYTSILEFAIEKLHNQNISVEVLEEFLSDDAGQDRYRSSIYEFCYTYALSHPFLGCGIGNDRVLITDNTLVRFQSVEGNYPHNIFIEFMIQFGYIPGVIISAIMVIFLLKYYIKERDKDAQKLATVMAGIGFFPLLISSTYIENASFFALIGFCCARLKAIKLDDNSSNNL